VSDDLLRYPIGKFHLPENVSSEERLRHIHTIAGAPARLRDAVSGLSTGQLDTPYREGGWTVRQVVHHVADSHMNGFIRFKLALTEAEPAIKPYDEAAWARLGDVAVTPIESSLQLLDSLHERWVGLLRGLSEAAWKKQFRHPARGLVSLEGNLALYAWHGDHHVGHIQGLRRRNGW
jgi:uncharacterized damage-inducible protein DinB